MAKQNYPKTLDPVKSLSEMLKKHSGRNHAGKVTVRHQGGRQKRYYRTIDFKRDKRNMPAEVMGIEYDPNRNSYIALVKYTDGELRYILQTEGMKAGDIINAGESAEIKSGNALPLINIPLGIQVHNIELIPGQGGKMIRGAGSAGVVIAREDKYIQIKLPSGEIKRFLKNCYATVGMVGNLGHKYINVRKAGAKRLRGIRPTVRGTAQNPRSHPHGGGEGRSGEGMHPKTPWGKPARGKRTRYPKKWSNKLLVSRRKK